jgi:hypothetical protein
MCMRRAGEVSVEKMTRVVRALNPDAVIDRTAVLLNEYFMTLKIKVNM